MLGCRASRLTEFCHYTLATASRTCISQDLCLWADSLKCADITGGGGGGGGGGAAAEEEKKEEEKKEDEEEEDDVSIPLPFLT